MLKQQDRFESTKEHKKRHTSRKRGKDEKKHENPSQTPVNAPVHMTPQAMIQVPVQQPAKCPPPIILTPQPEPEGKNDYVQIVFDVNDVLPPPPVDPLSNNPAGLVSPIQPSPGMYDNQPATPIASIPEKRKSDTSDPGKDAAKGQQQQKKPTKSKSSSSNNDDYPDSDSNSSETEKDRRVRRKGSIREIGVVLRKKTKKHGNAKSIKAKKSKKLLKKSGSK